jgi:hypothetical protein
MTTATIPERIGQLLERGCRVIPLYWARGDGSCSCGGEACKTPAKHPIHRDWQTRASSNSSTVEAWLRRWPNCNWGWVMGDEYITLDLDRKNGQDGTAALHELETTHGALARDCYATTASGAYHLVLRNPNGTKFKAATGWRPGIDIRTGNSLIVVEPSATPRGQYRFGAFGEPGPCPDWLLALLPRRDDEAAGALEFELDETAELPERARRLLDSEPEGWFAKAYRHTGKEPSDKSDSGWDHFVLKQFLGRLSEASDQELADLICAHRAGEKGGGWDKRPARGQRVDYVQRTILAARAAAGSQAHGASEGEGAQSGSNGSGPAPGPAAGEAEPMTTVDPSWPEPPAEDAFHGLAGRLAALIDPYVESDQVSTLVQFLGAFGIAVGLHPHFMVGATRHAPATYIGLVGRTSRARKGTSWDPVETLFRAVDAQFSARVMSGVGSGERLVWLVRDPLYDKKGELVDEGAQDRRLLLQEPELARLLTVVNREGSTMSAYLRQAYDGKPLRNEVKTNGSSAPAFTTSA